MITRAGGGGGGGVNAYGQPVRKVSVFFFDDFLYSSSRIKQLLFIVCLLRWFSFLNTDAKFQNLVDFHNSFLCLIKHNIEQGCTGIVFAKEIWF